MWNDTVTLYIDDTSIRLLVSRGQRVKKWADVNLEPGLIKDTVVVDEKAVAEKIKKLLQSQKVKAKKISLGFSGLHSLTRPASLPQLPRAMIHEAVGREARRILPVPLDQIYLSWIEIPGLKGKFEAFLAATPRKTVDSLMKTLQIAGLKARHMTIKPMALTKALPVNTAIVLDLEPSEYDIVIMAEGVAQPIRSVALPTEELTWEKKLNLIVSELERTIKFYDSNNPERTLNTNVPIYISGEFLAKPDYIKDIAKATGRPVMVCSPKLKGLEQMDLGRYMVNISMVAGPQSLARAETYPIANLNLLPAAYQPKPISMTKLVAIPSGAAVVGLIVPLVMVMQNTTSNIADLQSQLDATNLAVNQKTLQKQELTKNVAELDKKIIDTKATLGTIQNAVNTLNTQHEYVNGDILITLSKAPLDIELASISQSASQLVITGTAAAETDIQTYIDSILSYARNLDLSKRYTECTVSSLTIAVPSGTQAAGGSGAQTGYGIQFTLTFSRGS